MSNVIVTLGKSDDSDIMTITLNGEEFKMPDDNTFRKNGHYVVTVTNKFGYTATEEFTIDKHVDPIFIIMSAVVSLLSTGVIFSLGLKAKKKKLA
jgi:hypothetical protein